MKKIAIIATMLAVSFISHAEDTVIKESELPKKIKTYLKTHFPNNPVLQASIDKELFSKSYEVILKNNISLEFNKKNDVKDISASSKLPDSVIAKPILDYVKSNFPNNLITDWELDDTTQKVELDNDMELEFDLKGKFLKIDS